MHKEKTILFASLFAIMILTFSMDSALAQNVNEETQNKDTDIQSQILTGEEYKVQVNELTKQEFKDDIKTLLGDEDSEDFQVKTDEIKAEYEDFFRTVIEQSRFESNTRTLTDDEILSAIDYIFYETIKDEKVKALEEFNSADKVDISFLEWLGIPTIHATCPTTTNPNYKQLRLDIDGGFFWPSGFNGDNDMYEFNGDNDMYGYTYDDNSRSCEREYTLYFEDEDHPFLDGVYDGIRYLMYQRTHDIEIFSIHNNNQIEFPYTWSSTNDYGCLAYDITIFGCHETTTKTYTPGETVFVSNTWNHMMDTSDTNPRYSKVSVP